MPTDTPTLLEESKCFLCHGISSEEAMELALLSRIANRTQNPPVLSVTYDPFTQVFMIHWTGELPDHWTWQTSEDGENDWIDQYNSLSPEEFEYVLGVPGYYVRVERRDALNITIGIPSNVAGPT